MVCNHNQAGDVEPNWKSEEVPNANAEPVKVVVGKTFKQMVDDSTKDGGCLGSILDYQVEYSVLALQSIHFGYPSLKTY